MEFAGHAVLHEALRVLDVLVAGSPTCSKVGGSPRKVLVRPPQDTTS